MNFLFIFFYMTYYYKVLCLNYIFYCRRTLVSTKLTISSPDDSAILDAKGLKGLRQYKLLRFANEAYDQGGLLIQEDVAHLLTTTTRTIQRDIKELRDEGISIPTRGSFQDIGPTLSHKTKIIELYLKGYEYTEIEQRTRHTGDAIKRYIVAFSRVLILYNKGYSPSQIRELIDSTEKVIGEYLDLYHHYQETAKERIAQILDPPSAIIPDLESKKGGVPP
jgi:biotin operon repressor